METINIKQLAAKLNLSTSTVSRAFRDNSGINEETKQRILEKAKEYNYQPNHLASHLRDKKSKTIAVVVPEIANNFFSRAINGIEKVARANGYHVLIYLTNDDFEKEVAFLHDLHCGRVEGIIMSVTGEANDHSYIQKLRRSSLPLVFFDRVYEDIETSKIITNDYDSSFMATSHLIGQGCTRIAYLAVNKNLSIGKMRMQGYLDALREANIPFNKDMIIDCSNELNQNLSILEGVFSNRKPDGVFASVERLAIASYYACNKLNLVIGEDIKVICFSSLEIAPLLKPALSTIIQPAFNMGIEAAEILFEHLKADGRKVFEKRVLKSKIIPRESTLGPV